MVLYSGRCSLPDELQLQQLLVSLEDWPLGKELSQNTPETSQGIRKDSKNKKKKNTLPLIKLRLRLKHQNVNGCHSLCPIGLSCRKYE